MSNILLSICMPTYNFGRFIGETLSSIIPQLNESVEIVVLDGGSQDNTCEVVKEFQKNPNIQLRYVKREARGGIDRDMDLSVQHAQGKYVWLFSSDDLMAEGALAKVLKAIESGLDCYLCNFHAYDLEIKKCIQTQFVLNLHTDQKFSLSNIEQRREFFRLLETSAGLFSFMSSLVVLRSRWMESIVEEAYFATCWAHVARICGMVKTKLDVGYLSDVYLFKRSGNDSFLDKGYVHRLGIGIYGYNKIATDFFGADSYETKQIQRALCNETPLSMLISIKSRVKDSQDEVSELNQIVRLLYTRKTVINRLRLSLYYAISPAVGAFIVKCYKRLSRNRLRESCSH